MPSPAHVYLPIESFPEYANFAYSFDFVTVLVALTAVYFIPSCVCLARMLHFYLNDTPPTTPNGGGLHPHVFKAFLLMQSWNTVYTLLDFLLVRIPTTTALTSFCYALPPGNLMPYLVAALYFSYYTSQLFTVLFCALRVLILYNPRSHNKLYQLCSLVFVFWPPATYVLSSIAAFPHTVSSSLCMQLDTPYQFGAVTISTSYVYGNEPLTVAHLVFSTVIVVAIVVTTTMMLLKLRKRKLMSTSNRPFHRTKAETTLTVTMLLILAPLVFTQSLSIASISNSPYYSYILVARPLLIDSRVNIVSCYFYFTHPIFKHKLISTSIAVRSLNSQTTSQRDGY